MIKENIERYATAIKNMSFGRFRLVLKRRYENIPNLILWNVPFGYADQNKKRLLFYKDIHKGKRCFIIANGPSLKKIDFSLLENEITIGMNRIYLMNAMNGFMPTYIACIDENSQLKQFADEYNDLNIPCFYNWNQRELFDKKDNQMFVRVKFTTGFSADIVKNSTYNGASVTYTCMQLAYYMGCNEVYLIGKDHEYKITKKAGAPEVSDGSEGNHFISGYYKQGQMWFAPEYEIEEQAYRIAKKYYEKNNRVIKDASIDGKLKVFEKVDFASLFRKK